MVYGGIHKKLGKSVKVKWEGVVRLIKVFKVEDYEIDLVGEYEGETSVEGVESYFKSLGFDKDDIDDFIGEGYWEAGYEKFVINLKDSTIIAEV